MSFQYYGYNNQFPSPFQQPVGQGGLSGYGTQAAMGQPLTSQLPTTYYGGSGALSQPLTGNALGGVGGYPQNQWGSLPQQGYTSGLASQISPYSQQLQYPQTSQLQSAQQLTSTGMTDVLASQSTMPLQAGAATAQTSQGLQGSQLGTTGLNRYGDSLNYGSKAMGSYMTGDYGGALTQAGQAYNSFRPASALGGTQPTNFGNPLEAAQGVRGSLSAGRYGDALTGAGQAYSQYGGLTGVGKSAQLFQPSATSQLGGISSGTLGTGLGSLGQLYSLSRY